MPRKTNIEAKVRALRQFIRAEGRMPGYNEMLSLFEYRSKNAVHSLIKKLEALGYLRKRSGKIAPAPRLTGSLKLLGSVAAGFPSPAEEELADTINLDEFLVERPESTFMLTVSGDSMIDAGIHPGDIALVEKGITPKPNDIVVAQVDDEWTIKYFTKDKRGVVLMPANKQYASIRPKNSLVIGGVLRALIRKYRQ